MSFHSWLRNRENGSRGCFGDQDMIYRTIYTSLEPKKSWNDIPSTSCNSCEYGGAYNLEFSLNGSILVAACEKKTIVLFDPVTEKQICTIKNAHNDSVNCVKFLDDRMFATCSDDSTVALWDTRNLKSKIRSLHGHSNWVKNIEYSRKDCLLVTSGFDGSIFTWDINSHTEQGFIYQKVFHTPGLMRCRLSPDENRLVICTTGGYLIIIHNLNLGSLAKDLRGFRPNLYRLMQLRQQFIPNAARFDHAFTKRQKYNRVELVSDFPEGNDAEVVSSLQIHPQGWCALSRNISYDESSEWTCVHDIQELSAEDEEMSEDEENDEEEPVTDDANQTNEPNQPSAAVSNDPANPTAPSRNDAQEGQVSNSDIWAAEVTIRNRNMRNENLRSLSAANVYGITSGIPLTPMEKQQKYMESVNRNVNRMISYIEEPNQGKGFIKELCFSSDGRVICSPYGYGVRLLSFNESCTELPFIVHQNYNPQPLHQIKIKECHSDIVVSTKFSPKFPLLVSGCLRGKIVWHQPVF